MWCTASRGALGSRGWRDARPPRCTFRTKLNHNLHEKTIDLVGRLCYNEYSSNRSYQVFLGMDACWAKAGRLGKIGSAS
jgi:hypothetical protein